VEVSLPFLSSFSDASLKILFLSTGNTTILLLLMDSSFLLPCGFGGVQVIVPSLDAT
jgi:hypothetical protein